MGDNDSAARGKKLLCVKSFHEINMLFLVKFLYLPTAKWLFNCIKENGGAWSWKKVGPFLLNKGDVKMDVTKKCQ